MLGWDKPIHKASRYKYDCLEFYTKDIHWFAFSFVMTVLHIVTIRDTRNNLKAPELTESRKKHLNDSYLIISLLLGVRVFQLLFCSRIYDQERSIISHSKYFYLVIFAVYCAIFVLWSQGEGGHYQLS